jgi:pimeloyl-ACP methyl ester carboxylesterase
MDSFIQGPAGRLAIRHKGLDASPSNAVILVQGANMSGQLGYDFSFDGRADYSMMEAMVGRGFGAVTFSIRGYRDSELSGSPLEVDTEAAIEDLDAVVAWAAGMGFLRPHLVGWSWGGRIVGHFAARHADRLDRLVLLDPALGGGNRIPFPGKEPWWSNTHAYFFDRLEAEFTELDARHALGRQVEALEPRSPNGIRLENETGSRQVVPSAVLAPTLMLYGHAAGAQNYMQGGVDRLEFFRALPNPDKAFVIVPGGGDYAHLQNPRARIFRAIADFLDG